MSQLRTYAQALWDALAKDPNTLSRNSMVETAHHQLGLELGNTKSPTDKRNPYNLTAADCVKIISILDDPSYELTEWEVGFVGSNLSRNQFSDKQKEIIAKLKEKYNVNV